MNNWSSNSGLNIVDMLSRFGTGTGGVGAPDLAALLPSNISGPLLEKLQTAPVAGGVAAPGFMDGMLGYRGPDGTQHAGWGGMAVGAASGLMNGFLGLQQLGVAKDSLNQSKKQFDMNWGAQSKLTNSRLEDRQASRVAAGGSSYTSVGDYMKKNGIGG